MSWTSWTCVCLSLHCVLYNLQVWRTLSKLEWRGKRNIKVSSACFQMFWSEKQLCWNGERFWVKYSLQTPLKCWGQNNSPIKQVLLTFLLFKTSFNPTIEAVRCDKNRKEIKWCIQFIMSYFRRKLFRLLFANFYLLGQGLVKKGLRQKFQEVAFIVQ